MTMSESGLKMCLATGAWAKGQTTAAIYILGVINITYVCSYLCMSQNMFGVCHFLDGWGELHWGPNLDEFQRRFDPKLMKQEGTLRLKNLYLTYLLELRAISKVQYCNFFIMFYSSSFLLKILIRSFWRKFPLYLKGLQTFSDFFVC